MQGKHLQIHKMAAVAEQQREEISVYPAVQLQAALLHPFRVRHLRQPPRVYRPRKATAAIR